MTSGHNLALRIATGEGKSTVPQLAIKMMRKSRPGGKVILTQPLDGLLMQSLRSSSCKTVMLSMGGEIKDGERDGTLSHGLDFILSDECNDVTDYAIAKKILDLHTSMNAPIERVYKESDISKYIKFARSDLPQTSVEFCTYRQVL